MSDVSASDSTSIKGQRTSSRKSRPDTTGFVVTLFGSAISWRSKRQAIVAQSSTEAEYVALAHVTREVIWLRNILAELGFGLRHPTPVMEDNESAARLAANPEFHERSKHIDVKYHLVREMVANGIISVEPARTDVMRADMFTKPLDARRLHTHRVSNGIHDLGDDGLPRRGAH